MQPNCLDSDAPQNNNKNGVTVQVEVVSRLVPGFIIAPQTLGQGRLILFVYEWARRYPEMYGIHLIENYKRVSSISGLHWDTAAGFLRACHKDSDGECDVWWRLICGRVREQVGGIPPMSA